MCFDTLIVITNTTNSIYKIYQSVVGTLYKFPLTVAVYLLSHLSSDDPFKFYFISLIDRIIDLLVTEINRYNSRKIVNR